MPNPTTSRADPLTTPCRLAAAVTASGILYLNPDQHYEMRHRSVTEAAAADVNPVFFTTDGDVPTVSYAAGRNRFTLVAAESPIPVGPGVEKLRFISAGTPTFDLFPSGLYLGAESKVEPD